MRVITFSRFFPVYHPRKGEPTGFIEKILTAQKIHTIRCGNRWRKGDVFSARFWTDKPYKSKQQEFAVIKIKKVFDIEINITTVLVNGFPINNLTFREIAENDGLQFEDFRNWFPKDKIFTGQIICWNENIEY